MPIKLLLRLPLILCCLPLTACISWQPAELVPDITLSPQQVVLASVDSDAPVLDVGVELSVNESDSLFNVEILPGVRIRDVSSGGPAASAGLRSGDVILAVDGVEVNQPDAVHSLAQSASGVRPFEFTVRRGTTVFAAEVLPRATGSVTQPRELYRADPVLSRAGYRSRLVTVEGQADTVAAEIVTLFDESPLPEAGLQVGDLILSLNGRRLSSAQDLVSRLNLEHEPGDRVTLTVVDGSTVRSSAVTLWDPGRRISSLSLGPLLRYEASLSPDSREFTLLDLWLISLYNYRQQGGERSHSILGLINLTSDYGELSEEQ